MEDFDSLVVGGGGLGCLVAAELAQRGERTLLVERKPTLAGGASSAGQALPPFYPQELGSAHRARQGLRRLANELPGGVANRQVQFLAIGRSAKVTAAQLDESWRQLGVPIGLAPDPVRRLFDPALVEAVFRVEEVVLDPVRLRGRLEGRLAAAGVEVRLGVSAQSVKPLPGGSLRVELPGGAVRARRVFNCAGARLNELQHRSGLPPLPLRHELAEVVFVEGPPQLPHAGLAVLGGPSFSLTPLPSAPHHAFQQSRFAAHAAWGDLGPDGPAADEILARVAPQTGFERMRREASRFVPCLGDLRYQRSVWKVRTSPADNGAPFLFHAHAGCRNLHAALGTRLDGVYDVLDRLSLILGERSRAAA